MAKIALIGAGSIVFSTTLLNDLFQTRCLNGSTIALMGPTLSKLQRVQQYAQKIIDKNKLPRGRPLPLCPPGAPEVHSFSWLAIPMWTASTSGRSATIARSGSGSSSCPFTPGC
ncbi:MAG: hypothetical protein ABSG63_13105 [Spirochaetia bacterium]